MAKVESSTQAHLRPVISQCLKQTGNSRFDIMATVIHDFFFLAIFDILFVVIIVIIILILILIVSIAIIIIPIRGKRCQRFHHLEADFPVFVSQSAGQRIQRPGTGKSPKTQAASCLTLPPMGLLSELSRLPQTTFPHDCRIHHPYKRNTINESRRCMGSSDLSNCRNATFNDSLFY